MLHHVINGPKAKQWHEKLPFLLASYREVPHRITGISPHQLINGTVARGAMAVLKDIWLGDNQQKVIQNREVAG